MAVAHQELRIDVLTGRHVILAAGRNDRPILTSLLPTPKKRVSDEYDPFLEGNEHDTPDERLALRKIGSEANQQNWLLRVVPNRYPAVSESGKTGDSTAYGVHDVVIECPDSRQRMTDLTAEELARVFFAWQTRLNQIADDQRIQATAVFRNEGSGAGASLPHCHSQILATDFIGNQLQQRIAKAAGFLQQPYGNHSTLFESWLATELDAEIRIVKATDLFVAVCPYASRVDCHTRFVPNGAATDFLKLTSRQLSELAGCVLCVAQAYRDFAGDVDQNLALILPPQTSPDAYPWMLEFLPRKNRFAGFEMLTDTDILTVPPEHVAAQLRQNIAEVQTVDPQITLQPEGYEWISER